MKLFKVTAKNLNNNTELCLVVLANDMGHANLRGRINCQKMKIGNYGDRWLFSAKELTC